MRMVTGFMSIQAQTDPILLFAAWFEEAKASEPKDANAMALATASPDGQPAVRMVLLKGFDVTGFVFYTNLESQKGRELAINPKAALCLHWKSLGRQVRIEGTVEPVLPEEADEYFASRPRDSRIGAWASQQSRPLAGRFDLEKAVAHYAAKYALGHVPRPPYWSGFRIRPARIEFWQDRPFRLHDRLVFVRSGEAAWTTEKLYP